MRDHIAWTLALALAALACSDPGGEAAGSDGSTPDARADGAAGVDATPPTERFVFCSSRTGNFEIYRWVDGVETPLTDDATFDSWWPRISPDRTQIVFYRSLVTDRPPTGGWDNNYEHAALWIMDADGAAPRQLLTLAGEGWTTQGVANWSPDGRSLVMTAQDATTHFWGIYVMDVASAAPLLVSRRDSFYIDPSFSPDGTRLVFAAFPPVVPDIDFAHLEIYTAGTDGADEVRLTTDDLRDHDPSWGADGTIAFETQTDPTFLGGIGTWGLRTVPAAGGPTDTVLDDGHINTLPRFAPGGGFTFHRLVFGGEGTWRIARVEADGSGLRELTDGTAEDVDADPY